MKTRLLFLPLLAAGCTAAGAGSAASGHDSPALVDTAPYCVTGTVGVEGTPPLVRPTVAGGSGDRVALQGEEARRVRLLTGALVTVCGEPTVEDGVMTVRTLALRQVDGLEAHLGRVAVTATGVTLAPEDGRPPVPLASVPDGLRSAPGGMAWVAGRWTDGRFQVLSFGVLSAW